ncbi:MAG: hypothetical protein ABI181_00110 [Mycobacteriaceae bacterium]
MPSRHPGAAQELVAVHGTEVWTLARALCDDEQAARAAVLTTVDVVARARVPRAGTGPWLQAILVRACAPPPPLAVTPLQPRRLDELTAPVREVAVLSGVAGLTVTETARALGRSRPAVARQLASCAAVALPPLPSPEPLPVELVTGLPDPGRDQRDPRGVRAPRPGRGRTVSSITVVVSLVAVLVGGLVLVDHPSTPDDRRAASPGPSAVPRGPVVQALGRAALARSAAGRALADQTGVPASGDLLLDQHLARCAAAVAESGATQRYPPMSTWSSANRPGLVTTAGVLSMINSAFLCETTPARVLLTGLHGVRAGATEVLAAGPSRVVVRNPERATVILRTAGARGEVGRTLVATNSPFVVVPLGSRTPASELSLTVSKAGQTTFDGPLPDAGTPAVIRMRTPRTVPARSRFQVEGACLEAYPRVPDPLFWSTAATLDLPGGRTLVLAAAPGAAGLCVVEGSQAVMASAPVVDPPSAGTQEVVPLNEGDPLIPGVQTMLLAVDQRATRLELVGTPAGVRCVASNGRGVCVAAPDQAAGANPLSGIATAYDAAGTVVAGPTQIG